MASAIEGHVAAVDARVDDTDHHAFAAPGRAGDAAAPDVVGIDPLRAGIGLQLALEIPADADDARLRTQLVGFGLGQRKRHAIGGMHVGVNRLELATQLGGVIGQADAAQVLQVVHVGTRFGAGGHVAVGAGGRGTGGGKLRAQAVVGAEAAETRRGGFLEDDDPERLFLDLGFGSRRLAGHRVLGDLREAEAEGDGKHEGAGAHGSSPAG